MWSIYWIHRTATGVEGFGHGDFKLAAMLGAWLGVAAVPVMLLIAFAAGATFGVASIIAGRARLSSAIPFGPFLAMAGWITLYWGSALTRLYLDWVLYLY